MDNDRPLTLRELEKYTLCELEYRGLHFDCMVIDPEKGETIRLASKTIVFYPPETRITKLGHIITWTTTIY